MRILFYTLIFKEFFMIKRFKDTALNVTFEPALIGGYYNVVEGSPYQTEEEWRAALADPKQIKELFRKALGTGSFGRIERIGRDHDLAGRCRCDRGFGRDRQYACGQSVENLGHHRRV